MAQIEQKLLIEELMNDKKTVITIPIYQRNYDWKTKDVEKLLSDIVEFNQNFQEELEEKYYLGNIIARTEVNKLDDELNNLILIDGQQRITTTILILAALRNEGLIDSLEISKVLNVQSSSGKLKINRMKDEDVIRKILNNNMRTIDEGDKLTNVYRNYDFIIKYFEKNSIKAQEIFDSMKRIVIVKVEVPKANETKMFETINSTGKKLSPADLIKLFILFDSHNFSDHDSHRLETLYEQGIAERFENTEELSGFYRYYNSIVGKRTLSNVGSIEIFKVFKLINADYMYNDMGEVEEMIQNITDHVSIFDAINNFKYEKHINKLYKYVFDKNSKTFYPLAHYLVQRYVDDVKSEEQMGPIMRVLAKISLFRNIGKFPDKSITTTIVTMFPDFEKYREGKSQTLSDFEDFIEVISSTKNYGIPTKEYMRNAILQASHYSENRTKLLSILIAAEVFSNKKGGTNVDFYQKFDLEHVFPQNDKKWRDEINDPQKLLELTYKRDNIGNMTLLSPSLNRGVSNGVYSEKRKWITSDTLRLSQYFVNVEEWTTERINERAAMLADVIYNHFNENRQTKYSDNKIELQSVIKTEKPKTQKEISERNAKYAEFFRKVKASLANSFDFDVSMTARGQIWMPFRLKGSSQVIVGSIVNRGSAKNKVMAISVDWSSEQKAKYISLANKASKINEMFTHEFSFKPTNKKGWGFHIDLHEQFESGVTPELIEKIEVTLKELESKMSELTSL